MTAETVPAPFFWGGRGGGLERHSGRMSSYQLLPPLVWSLSLFGRFAFFFPGKPVMRAQESADPCKHLPLIPPGGPTSGEHPPPPTHSSPGGSERGREGGREVAGSQREPKSGAIARGQAHRGRSKRGARPRSGQNKHDSGPGGLFALRFLIWGREAFLFFPWKL